MIGETSHDSNEAEQVDAALDACRKVALTRGRIERIDEQGRSQQQLFPDDGVASVRNNNSPWVVQNATQQCAPSRSSPSPR